MAGKDAHAVIVLVDVFDNGAQLRFVGRLEEKRSVALNAGIDVLPEREGDGRGSRSCDRSCSGGCLLLLLQRLLSLLLSGRRFDAELAGARELGRLLDNCRGRGCGRCARLGHRGAAMMRRGGLACGRQLARLFATARDFAEERAERLADRAALDRGRAAAQRRLARFAQLLVGVRLVEVEYLLVLVVLFHLAAIQAQRVLLPLAYHRLGCELAVEGERQAEAQVLHAGLLAAAERLAQQLDARCGVTFE